MDKLKLEDFMCGDANCLKIPNPGDKIYSCSASYGGDVEYSCENCYKTSSHYHIHGRRESALKFDPKLTKLVSEHFNPSLSAQEEMETLLQESAEKIESLETQVEELKEKNEKIESDKKKIRDLMVVAKTKIGNLEEENKNLKAGKTSASCNEGQERKYFCSNSKNGCQEEFLTQKTHEKSCIYQKVPCPSVNCQEVITFKDVDDHMEESHMMEKVNKEWSFEGTEKDLNEIICCLSSYDQKFFPQVFVKDKNLHF